MRRFTCFAATLVVATLAAGSPVCRAGTVVFSGTLSPTSATTILEGQSVSAAVAYRLTHSGTSSGNTGHFYYNFVKFNSGDGQQVRDWANGRDYSGQQTWSGLPTAFIGSEPQNLEAQPAGWPGNTNTSPGKRQDFSTSFTYLDDGLFTLNAHGDTTTGTVFGMNPQAALWFSTGGTPASGLQGPVFNQGFNVTVLNVAPTITLAPADSLQTIGVPFNLSAAATDPGVLDTLTFSWDLNGDGQFDDLVQSPGAGGAQSAATSAVLNAVGLYTLGVRVTDGDGGEDVRTFAVEIVPEPSSLILALMAGVFVLHRVRRRRG